MKQCPVQALAAPRFRIVRFLVVSQKLDLLRVGRLDHGTVPPDHPAPHADPFAGESFEVDALGLKRARILARDADGEIAKLR
jgi:hypothetical protein